MPRPKSRTQRLIAFAKKPIRPLVSWVSLGTLTTAVGAVVYLEREYVHAADFQSFKSSVSTGQEINRLTTEVQTMDLRLQLLRQNLYQVTYAQGPMTRDRRVELDRLSTAIRDTGVELDAKRRLLDRLRTGQ